MAQKERLEWEEIDTHHTRAKVPGGWLVKAYEDVTHSQSLNGTMADGWDFRIAMAFVPDPSHAWDIKGERA